MTPYVGCIIQARLTSSRFPRKILELIDGIPVLEHIVNRVHKSHLIDKVVIASPHSPECCLNEEIFIGSEEDVLDRYYQASKKYGFDIIVRITSDCPLIPVSEINRVITRLLRGDTDYVRNFPNVPDGWDVEAFTFKMLEEAWLKTSEQTEREHVTPYMKRSTNAVLLEAPKLSLDTREDLERIKEFYELEQQERIDYGWHGQLLDKLHQVSTTESQAQSHTDIQQR